MQSFSLSDSVYTGQPDLLQLRKKVDGLLYLCLPLRDSSPLQNSRLSTQPEVDAYDCKRATESSALRDLLRDGAHCFAQ
jgi:hypothetical protein